MLDPTTEPPYTSLVHRVAEMPRFIKKAAEAGMSDAEREALVDYLADNPECGRRNQGHRRLS